MRPSRTSEPDRPKGRKVTRRPDSVSSRSRAARAGPLSRDLYALGSSQTGRGSIFSVQPRARASVVNSSLNSSLILSSAAALSL
jgi:hypothetical protein